MWVPETWETEEDIQNDIVLMAEYCVPVKNKKTLPARKIPDTILQYKKQMEENKRKPLNSDIDDTVSYVVSGRGRGIKDRVIRPGEIVDSHPLDEAELKKQIRQVCGFGYSNELIEKSIKAKVYDPKNEGESDSNFKLVPSLSSSGRSSNENTPIKKTKPAKSNFSEQ
ncbi:uncharacterized protein LOC123004157 [Tribolium madens]|uniref:uncharacterized protein LOC123004157 n=1 Tax=Tribolium madens TaxID=41895 RepID=UPI001CF734F2|nr:uncharacterized protein LOC123004157 [Tribolium madens]XP_044253213.1 uncharacterized protein LOC123004157 [Tribolium madens]XP_044253214.1 uncharacterized protein LOC123004157 [Tribolium madens]